MCRGKAAGIPQYLMYVLGFKDCITITAFNMFDLDINNCEYCRER